MAPVQRSVAPGQKSPTSTWAMAVRLLSSEDNLLFRTDALRSCKNPAYLARSQPSGFSAVGERLAPILAAAFSAIVRLAYIVVVWAVWLPTRFPREMDELRHPHPRPAGCVSTSQILYLSLAAEGNQSAVASGLLTAA